jgi:ribonuclease P protein component
LKRRADFLGAAKGKRLHAKGFLLQAAPRQDGDGPAGHPQGQSAPRFGFTVTKKIGGAVLRNRIRRRLKEALRLIEPLPGRPSHDYVILARPEAAGMPFSALQAEIVRALGKIETGGKPAKTRQDPRRDSRRNSGGKTRAACA